MDCEKSPSLGCFLLSSPTLNKYILRNVTYVILLWGRHSEHSVVLLDSTVLWNQHWKGNLSLNTSLCGTGLHYTNPSLSLACAPRSSHSAHCLASTEQLLAHYSKLNLSIYLCGFGVFVFNVNEQRKWEKGKSFHMNNILRQ